MKSRFTSRCILRAAETKRPEIKGPFWVVLVFGRAKRTSIKGGVGSPLDQVDNIPHVVL